MDYKILSLIPVQEAGRVKPMDTYVRETVRFVTGREEFEGRPAMETVLDWITHPEVWEKKDLILVENLDLKAQLGVSKDQKRLSPDLLIHHEGFMVFVKLSHAKQEQKTALDPKEKEALAVFGRLQKFEELLPGDALTLIPLPDPKTRRWSSIGDLKRAYDRDPSAMPDSAKEILLAFAGVLKGFDGKDQAVLTDYSDRLASLLAQVGGAESPSRALMAREAGFNALKPFRKAWMLHLAALILLGLSLVLDLPKLFFPGTLFFGAGILVSLYGFVLRCLIAGRPPVSNMYESLIWVTFGMTVFAMVFEALFRNRIFALCGSALAVVGFVLADNVPTILDPSIQPIEPVLRSNFWLTIHVLTITLSYAAFLLSLGVGHVCLWSLWRHGSDRERVQRQTRLLYRVVQVGVVLLAAGTILGGVWANYSWGRFWGWDPKETWALIALLGYVAVLHGRLAGWLRDLGFTLGVISAFLGVLMAWYGVNFILGVGLHSYGFSKGGLPYVIGFVAVEILLMVIVGLKARAIRN